MQVVATIIPIFAVIALGGLARWKGFLEPHFLGPANRLVFYLAIPAMIFRALAGASLQGRFEVGAMAATILAVVAVYLLSWLGGLFTGVRRRNLGPFVQCSIHGNLGYIGFAVAYYALGNDGLVRASIIGGFLILLQNFLGVFVLQYYASAGGRIGAKIGMALKVLVNPVILACIAGTGVSLLEIPVPTVLDRSLEILGGLALPMALLIIGASMSFDLVRSHLKPVVASGVIKTLVLPGVGLGLYILWGLAPEDYMPGLILLASPTATVTFVMAREMKCDADFAVAAVSISTMLSALTFSVWLNAGG